MGSTLGSQGPGATSHAFIAAIRLFTLPWSRLSNVADLIVVVFGLLLWVCFVFSLLCLGMRAMSTA